MNNKDRLNKIHEKLANLRSDNVVPVPQSRMFVAWYWAGDYTLGPTGLVKIPVHLHRYNCGSKTGLTQRDQRWDKSGDPETSTEAYVFDGRTWTFGLALAALTEIYIKDNIYNEGGFVYCFTCGSKLEYLTPEQKNLKKGNVSLFCRPCSLKYHGEVNELREYAAAMKAGRVPKPEIKEVSLAELVTDTVSHPPEAEGDESGGSGLDPDEGEGSADRGEEREAADAPTE